MWVDRFVVAATGPDNENVARSATPIAGHDETPSTQIKDSAGWHQSLDRSVKLPSGLVLKTLGDAGAYILDQPDLIRERQWWHRAAELLIEAASEVGRIKDATAMLELAVSRDRPTVKSRSIDRLDQSFAACDVSELEYPAASAEQAPRAKRSILPNVATFLVLAALCRKPVNEAARVGTDLIARAAAELAPPRKWIAVRIRDCKVVVLNLLGLPADFADSIADRELIRRGVLFGLGASVIIGALLLLRLTTASLFSSVLLFGVTSVLTLTTVILLLIVDLFD